MRRVRGRRMFEFACGAFTDDERVRSNRDVRRLRQDAPTLKQSGKGRPRDVVGLHNARVLVDVHVLYYPEFAASGCNHALVLVGLRSRGVAAGLAPSSRSDDAFAGLGDDRVTPPMTCTSAYGSTCSDVSNPPPTMTPTIRPASASARTSRHGPDLFSGVGRDDRFADILADAPHELLCHDLRTSSAESNLTRTTDPARAPGFSGVKSTAVVISNRCSTVAVSELRELRRRTFIS